MYQGTDTTAKNTGDEKEINEEEDSYSRNNGADEDDEFWNRYDTYYPYGYNWQRKDDPYSKSYYNKDRWATRNILASNIGLTAKRGSNNNLLVAVSNILTTEPMNDVELEVMDYHQIIISKGKSGSDGFATIDTKRKPYLLIAKKGNERAYLKLDDGSSLALSRFDVSGEEIKNGIKGFIFGERGVWRPGDTMYINCLVEDKEKKLPKIILLNSAYLHHRDNCTNTPCKAMRRMGFIYLKPIRMQALQQATGWPGLKWVVSVLKKQLK